MSRWKKNKPVPEPKVTEGGPVVEKPVADPEPEIAVPEPAPSVPQLTLLERSLAECPAWLRSYFCTGQTPPLGAVDASLDYNELRHSTGSMHVLWAKHGEAIVKGSGRQAVWASEVYKDNG